MTNTNRVSLSGNDKLILISNFATMYSAGIPILETVQALLEDSRANQRKILETLQSDLSSGRHVYFSFAKFPRVWSFLLDLIKRL